MKLFGLVVPLAVISACSAALAPDTEESEANEAPRDASTEAAIEPDSRVDSAISETDAADSREAGPADAATSHDTGPADAGPADAASADAALECREPYARCVYKTDTELDRQSARQIAGSGCLGGSFLESEVCDFTEQCDDGTEPVARCVSCGPNGARFATRDVDGVRREECRGCGCGGWSVYGCYAETASFGQPWIDVVWQEDFEVMRFAVLQDGQVRSYAHPDQQVTLRQSRLRTFELQLEGLVDWEVELDAVVVDNFEQSHAWNMHARVVGRCR